MTEKSQTFFNLQAVLLLPHTPEEITEYLNLAREKELSVISTQEVYDELELKRLLRRLVLKQRREIHKELNSGIFLPERIDKIAEIIPMLLSKEVPGHDSFMKMIHSK